MGDRGAGSEMSPTCASASPRRDSTASSLSANHSFPSHHNSLTQFYSRSLATAIYGIWSFAKLQYSAIYSHMEWTKVGLAVKHIDAFGALQSIDDDVRQRRSDDLVHTLEQPL